MANYAVTYLSSAIASWPLDVGDDPAFGTSERLHGPVTWGICRADIRKAAKAGDVIVFFAAQAGAARSDVVYRFVGYGRVARLLSQVDIWRKPDLGLFRDYQNLLLRPGPRRSLIHDESPHPRTTWHADWLFRLASAKTATAKAVYERAGRQTPVLSEASIGGEPMLVSKNYVVFEDEGDRTFVAADPPQVATAVGGRRNERWLTTPMAKELRSVLFAGASRDRLRTSETGFSHPKVRLVDDSDSLAAALRSWALEHRVAPRR